MMFESINRNFFNNWNWSLTYFLCAQQTWNLIYYNTMKSKTMAYQKHTNFSRVNSPQIYRIFSRIRHHYVPNSCPRHDTLHQHIFAQNYLLFRHSSLPVTYGPSRIVSRYAVQLLTRARECLRSSTVSPAFQRLAREAASRLATSSWMTQLLLSARARAQTVLILATRSRSAIATVRF